MRVLDSTGEQLGAVEDIKVGDPGAATAEGQVADDGLMGDIARAFGSGPDLNPQATARLLRVGFVKIDRRGFMAGEAYAAADQIEDVAGDTVRLSVAADELYTG